MPLLPLTLTLAATMLAPGSLALHEPTLDWRAARLASSDVSRSVDRPASAELPPPPPPVPSVPQYPAPPLVDEIPPPPPPPSPPAVTTPQAMDAARLELMQAQMLYQSREKSIAAALLLELFTLPGVGLAYANAWTELTVTLAGIGAGAGVIAVAAVTQTRSFETFFTVGALIVGGARIFGIVASIFGAQRYNEALREELGLTPQLLLATVPGGGAAGVTLRF